MNESFVCVKVDREERPDVDALYMEAVQAMTGQGGWPLNVFLTPEQLPFYGGTYFPPEPRPGMPAWTQVLQAIAEAWEQHREDIRAGGERLRERLSGGAQLKPSAKAPTEDALDEAVAGLHATYDERNGGFGGAPKFPHASAIEFLLCRAAAGQAEHQDQRQHAMALHTLHAMASGGIFDQLGGGFHRYAVDATWTVPHFEKMLYDNALLARAYLHGAKLAADTRLEQVCRQTLDWMLREMRGPEGGFYAALDADSEGVEGQLLRVDRRRAAARAGRRRRRRDRLAGRDRGRQLRRPASPRARAERAVRVAGPSRLPRSASASARRCWRCARRARARAWTTSGWRAGTRSRSPPWPTPEQRWARLATSTRPRACAEFVLTELRDDRGRLLRSYSQQRASLDGYLEDHAYLLEALLALFEATCEERWFVQARALADQTIELFADPQWGGFFTTASDHEELIARRKDVEDTPIPSGNASAALGLLRLSQLTGEREYARRADSALALLDEIAPRHPSAFGHLLQAMHWRLAPARPIACPVPRRDRRPYRIDR